ncbi:MAG: hypothetical protein QM831_36180 [Kofleriaceae bacterium]
MTFCEDLHDLLCDAARDTFQAYGTVAQLLHAVSMSTNPQLGAVLGLTGYELNCTVLVVADPITLSTTNPTPNVADSKWLGEATNQIAGRFKNELARRGIDVAMAVPVVLSATRLVPMVRNSTEPIHLRIEHAYMTIWLEYEGELELPEPRCEVTREGEALLF